jgi:hypothetical protein
VLVKLGCLVARRITMQRHTRLSCLHTLAIHEAMINNVLTQIRNARISLNHTLLSVLLFTLIILIYDFFTTGYGSR